MNIKKELRQIILILSAIAFVSSIVVLVSFKVALLSIFIIPCIYLCYRYPRWGLLLFLAYLPFGGTVTYLFAKIQVYGGYITYSQDTSFVKLVKDTFYFPALLSILITTQSFKKILSKIKPLLYSLMVWLGFCLFTLVFVNFAQQLQFPKENSLVVGIIGIKILFSYVPLVLCGYYLISEKKDLDFVFRLLIILVIISCSLCFVQYIFLVTGVCPGNSELPAPADTRASLQAKCFVGGSLLYNPAQELIKLPGTFAAPWQWGWFLISSSFITYGTSLSESSKPWRILSWIALGEVIATTVISGSRIALLLVHGSLFVLMLITQKYQKNLLFKLSIIALFIWIIITEFPLVQQPIQNFINRWKYSPPDKFMQEQFQWIIQGRLEWLGHGLGKATTAAYDWTDIQLIETFYVKLLYEIGILGLLSFLIVVSLLSWLSFQAYRSIQEQSLRNLGLCLWVFIVFISYNPYYYPLTVDPVAVYYWFFAGILLKLPELEN